MTVGTIQRVNFEPKSDFMIRVETRPFALADKTLLNPLGATAIVDGEFVTFDSTKKLVRAASVAAAGNHAALPCWVNWGELGRTDQQALSQGMLTLAYLGMWEADYRLYDDDSMTLGGLVSPASITLGTKTVVGVVNAGTIVSPTASRVAVGIVTRLPSVNGGKLRIRGGMFF
jgi:hypothetical protein